MAWLMLKRRPLRYCVPCAGLSSPVTLERLYPSRETVGAMEYSNGDLCCLRIMPGNVDVEVYRVVAGDGGVVSIDTFHYVDGQPPSSLDTVVAVSKAPGDSVEGYLLDASTGSRIQTLEFIDKGDWAYAFVKLPAPGVYYAVIKLGVGIFVVDMFFRRRFNIIAYALVWALIMGGRRVIIIG